MWAILLFDRLRVQRIPDRSGTGFSLKLADFSSHAIARLRFQHADVGDRNQLIGLTRLNDIQGQVAASTKGSFLP